MSAPTAVRPRIAVMAKSNRDEKPRRTGGKNKTPRVNVGIPENWHAVARKVAAKRQQPVVYAIIALLQQEAERLQIEALPPTPWEEGPLD